MVSDPALFRYVYLLGAAVSSAAGTSSEYKDKASPLETYVPRLLRVYKLTQAHSDKKVRGVSRKLLRKLLRAFSET